MSGGCSSVTATGVLPLMPPEEVNQTVCVEWYFVSGRDWCAVGTAVDRRSNEGGRTVRGKVGSVVGFPKRGTILPSTTVMFAYKCVFDIQLGTLDRDTQVNVLSLSTEPGKIGRKLKS